MLDGCDLGYFKKEVAQVVIPNWEYEVLTPLAEKDLIQSKGISPRLTDLTGKTVGLYAIKKRAAIPILTAIEQKLKERFPTLKFSLFGRTDYHVRITESADKPRFDDWVKGVDTIVAAVGD